MGRQVDAGSDQRERVWSVVSLSLALGFRPAAAHEACLADAVVCFYLQIQVSALPNRRPGICTVRKVTDRLLPPALSEMPLSKTIANPDIRQHFMCSYNPGAYPKYGARALKSLEIAGTGRARRGRERCSSRAPT